MARILLGALIWAASGTIIFAATSECQFLAGGGNNNGKQSFYDAPSHFSDCKLVGKSANRLQVEFKYVGKDAFRPMGIGQVELSSDLRNTLLTNLQASEPLLKDQFGSVLKIVKSSAAVVKDDATNGKKVAIFKNGDDLLLLTYEPDHNLITEVIFSAGSASFVKF